MKSMVTCGEVVGRTAEEQQTKCVLGSFYKSQKSQLMYFITALIAGGYLLSQACFPLCVL